MPGATVERRTSELALLQQRQQVVEHGADVAHVDLDVREARRAEREHDRARLRAVGGAVGEGEVDAGEQLVGAGLLERHPALAQGGEHLGVVVDAEHREPGVGEAQREREADPAQSDDADVVAHGR